MILSKRHRQRRHQDKNAGLRNPLRWVWFLGRINFTAFCVQHFDLVDIWLLSFDSEFYRYNAKFIAQYPPCTVHKNIVCWLSSNSNLLNRCLSKAHSSIQILVRFLCKFSSRIYVLSNVSWCSNVHVYLLNNIFFFIAMPYVIVLFVLLSTFSRNFNLKLTRAVSLLPSILILWYLRSFTHDYIQDP